MSKKAILLLAYILFFLWSPVDVFAVIVSIPDSNASTGETVTIPVIVDNATGIAGFQFTITYDLSVLQATGVVKGNLTAGWMIISNLITAGQIRVSSLDPSLNGLSGGSGSLVGLVFNVVGNPGDSTLLNFTLTKLTDNIGAKIPSSASPGTFSIPVTNLSPIANAGGTYTGIEGQAITLDGSGSSDSEGPIALYEWDINNDDSYEYSSTLPTQNHTYAQQGTYTIKLRVTDNSGATGEALTTAAISDTSPTANFTGSPTTGPAPLTVNFTNSSTGYDLPLSYQWDFDDNGSVDSTLQNPSATYIGQGIYSVKLTATDLDGSTNALIRANYITVTPPIYTLTVTKSGSGSGTVTSSPVGIICGSDCTETYTDGTVVTLTATADAGSTFTNWTGGGCSGTGNCTVTMNADTTVTAAFDVCSNLLVRIGTTYYSSLQTAYNSAGEGSVIQTQDVQLIENLSANLNKTVTIDGGYDCNYATKTGWTRLKGQMTISNGKVTVKDFILKK